MLGWRLRKDPMPEIEYEGTLAQGRDDRPHRGRHRGASSEEQHRIEVALYGVPGLQVLTGPGQGNRGIEANRVDAGDLGVGGVEYASAARKADDRHVWMLRLQGARDSGGGLDHPT